MSRRGFSVVELIVVITIMIILVTLGTVNLRSSQKYSRDNERKTDVETLAQHLETYYTSGSETSTNLGTYPATTMIGSETNYLIDLDVKSLTAPDQTNSSLIAATCSGVCVETTAGVTPQPSIDQYVYQPIKSDGNLCSTETDECIKFNLYYKLEVETEECPAPNNLCIITSKNQ